MIFQTRTFRKCIIPLLLAAVLGLMTIGSLTGCGSSVQSPEGIVLQQDGGDTSDHIYIVDKTQDSLELTAVLTPSDFDGEITWTSSDAGVVKVSAAEGDTCSLKLLKVGYAKITATCGEMSASVTVTVQKNQDNLSEKDIALTVGGVNYSVEKLNFLFVDTYNQFVAYYGSMASSYGLDTSTGISGLADQDCSYSDDGTWKGFFDEQTVDTLLQWTALCTYADENGIVLEQEDEQDIQDKLDDIIVEAEDAGYDSTDSYIESIYGDGATLELYEAYVRQCELAEKAYDAYEATLTYTEEAIAAHYAALGYTDEDGNDYPMTSMRHILILAEADENGDYTDEAIQAAHDKAEEIYEEWKAGEASEDSFAELANEYSEDEGSDTNGGLYENIYKNQMVTGINDWLFADGRAYGDTTIVDNNGGYVGTHIVFFCGQGEDYSTYLSVSDLQSNDMSDWLSDLTESIEVTEGAAFSSIGDID